MGRWPRRISRSKHSSTPLIFSPCRAIKDFTALLLPVGTHEHSQVGQRRSTPFFGCGEAAVAERGAVAAGIDRRLYIVGGVINHRAQVVERVGALREAIGRIIE